MKLNQILSDKNLVELLSDDERVKISDQVIKKFEADKQSRDEKLSTLQDIVKLAMSVADEKDFPWANASNVIYPLISTAIIDFGAKCSPEILRDDFIVKAKIIGKDDGKPLFNMAGEPMVDEQGLPVMKDVSAKQERGDRVSTYMNYFLSEKIENWQEDTDKLLISLAATGTMFRKTYESYDSTQSEIVYPDKLFVHDKTTCFDKAAITHLIELYENEIQEKIANDEFITFTYDDNSDASTILSTDLSNTQGEVGNSDSGLSVFLEQCCWLDLDEDGFLEPYVATVYHKGGDLVRLVPRFKEEDIKKKGDKIISIKAHNPYTPYHFIPSPDGSFYGIGLGHLLFNLNKAVNTSINQLTDAATLQNTGGGFIAKTLKIKEGAFKMRPNEFKVVDAMGGNIRDAIVSLPTPEPSQTLFALLGFLVQAGKDLGSLRDVLNGENAANVQATTMMALVEQGITQFKSIYKRIYRSLKKEFKIVYKILGDTLSNAEYAEVLDENAKDVSVKRDFTLGGFDIVPIADTASITNTQRIAKASFLLQFNNDPFIDQIKLRQRVLSAYNIDNYQDLITIPAPATPDANTILAQAEMLKAENRVKEVQIRAIEVAGNLEKGKYDAEKVVAEIERIKTESIKNISDALNKEKDVQINSILRIADSVRKDIESKAQNYEENENNTESSEEIEEEGVSESLPEA